MALPILSTAMLLKLLFIHLIALSTSLLCSAQILEKGAGLAGMAPSIGKIYRANNSLYTLGSISIGNEPLINFFITKMDLYGKIIWQKRYKVVGYERFEFNTYFDGKYFYNVGSLGINQPITLSWGVAQKIDTNGVIVASRAWPNGSFNSVDESLLHEGYFTVNGRFGKALVCRLDTNLNLSMAHTLEDTLNRSVELIDIVHNGNSFYGALNTKSSGIDASKPALIELDSALQFVRGSLYPNETGSGVGFGVTRSLTFLDSSRALTTLYYKLSFSQYLYYSIWNHRRDSLEFIDLRFPINPVLDTLPILESQERTRLYGKDSAGSLTYFHYRIYDSFEFKNNEMVGKWNPLTRKIENFRRSPLIRNFAPRPPGNIKSTRYSLYGNRNYQAQDFYGEGIYTDIDLLDTTNCLAVPDTFVTIIKGPKIKLDRYRIVMKDTTLTFQDIPVIVLPIKFCEFDFCNPLVFAGLGPDIVTCEDSVLLQGAVVYPDQKLEWSTGDTTVRLKVKAGQTYSIRISGHCGSFTDTILVSFNPLTAVRFTQNEDTFTSCKPILLQPIAQQWISPRWFTPRGLVLNLQQLLADTSGFYIVQNDTSDCARRDTIYIDLQPVSKPDLQLQDTVITCKDLLLSPQASQWANPVWQTPNGLVSGQTSLLATLSGKYVIQNNVLGCPANDSVFIIRKNASVISFFNQPDTLFTCKAILLSPVAQPFINPVWKTPSGMFANVSAFNATTTGKYKVTNDIGNCSNSDSIFIAFRDTADIDFVLRSDGTTVTNFNIILKENQFPYVADAITQTLANQYRWYLNGQLQNGNSFTQAFSFSASGNYTIRLVTTSSDSCLGKAEKMLVINRQILPPLLIPSLVTQNGDKRNDLLEILQLPFYPDNELVIYNRWGKEIFKAKPYQNNWPPADLLGGTYFYRLSAGETTYQGWVEVMR